MATFNSGGVGGKKMAVEAIFCFVIKCCPVYVICVICAIYVIYVIYVIFVLDP